MSTSPFFSYTAVPADANDTATLGSVLIKPRILLVFAPATSKIACIYNYMVLSHINQNWRVLHNVQDCNSSAASGEYPFIYC